ncbi:GrpE protein 1, mitochondrial [Clydaea vesicula]|uniref:GrpE protein homolog n=1 Tax=Clydaea vesicula TaxID=447962 RepID=A0AAD5UB81_9FUNG|nr:GrpE protein 1, mitochondrial [Clydaea vesicula]KAJ3397849.1 GrpE protein 1, mitochondrial [Lobulomyces angularis]
MFAVPRLILKKNSSLVLKTNLKINPILTHRFHYSTDKPTETNSANAETTQNNATKNENVSKVEEYETKIAQLQDSYRRALAETENIRQRSKKEIDAAKVYSIQKFASDLLDSADILTLALQSVPKEEVKQESQNKHLKDLFEGVSMTKTELLKTFKRHGVEPFDPIGEKFDHNKHEALFQNALPGKEAGTVFHTTKIGYTINGRVLRPAKVGVVKSED